MTGMTNNVRLDEDSELETALAELAPRPAPQGLKARVLGSATASRRNVAMNPRMRSVATVCLVLIFLAVAGDAIVSKSQTEGILAPAGRFSGPASSDEDIRPILAELSIVEAYLGIQPGEQSFLTRSLLVRMGPGSESRDNLPNTLKKLEGWDDDEGTENPD